MQYESQLLRELTPAEQAIAERLLRIAAGRLPGPSIDVDRALPWVARKTGLLLAPGQAEAVRLALTSKAVVITGGPGVGKTNIVDAILRILVAKGVELVLCADRTRRPADERGHRARGPDHPPAAGRSIRGPAASDATRTIRSTAACWSWTRPRWWTSR